MTTQKALMYLVILECQYEMCATQKVDFIDRTITLCLN